MRFLTRLLLTLEESCKGPKKCPDARETSCRECGHSWEPANLFDIQCPECKSRLFVREYCEECPHRYLDKHSPTLEMTLVRRAIEWQNSLSQECRFNVTLADIPADEYAALQILRSEQMKAREQERKRAQQHPHQ